MKWEFAPDVQEQIGYLVNKLSLDHLNLKRVFCFRSFGSKSHAFARIWSLPRIWQKALREEPAYCLEILHERFDKLGLKDQRKVLIHEFLHIPQNFSGSLLPHRKSRGEGFGKRVEKLFKGLEE